MTTARITQQHAQVVVQTEAPGASQRHTPTTYAAAVATAGGTGLWPLDDASPGPFLDAIGSADLTVSTATGISFERYTPYGPGAEFSGASHVVINSDAGLRAALGTGDGSFAIACWFKSASSNFRTIVRQNGSPAWYGIDNNDKLRIYNAVAGATSVTDGNWHLAVYNVGDDGTNGNGWAVWLDGALDGFAAGSPAAWTADNMSLADNGGGGERFAGRLMGLALFPAALTPDEIATLYTAPAAAGLAAKVYNGSTWDTATVKVYDGADWVTAAPKVYDGADWLGA